MKEEIKSNRATRTHSVTQISRDISDDIESITRKKPRRKTIKELADEYDASNRRPIHLPSQDLYAISENNETFQKIKSRKNWRKIRQGTSSIARNGERGSEMNAQQEGDVGGGSDGGDGGKRSVQRSSNGRSITTLESFLDN